MIREGLEWTLFDTPLSLEEVTAPTVIPDNTLKLYAKDKAGVSALYYKGDDEVEHDLSLTPITGSGAAGQVAFFNGATSITGENNLFWDSTNNRLGIGSATPLSDLEVITTGSALPRGIAQTQYSGDGNAPGLQLRKARGAEALPTVALLDDALGEINFFGYTGSAFTRTALIQAKAAENYSATNQGSYFRIFTIPAGSTTLTERWHFGPEGQFGIGGATYGSVGNVFTSGGASAAPTWSFPDSQYFTGTNWVDLTDGGATTLHKHDHGGQDGLLDDDHTLYALLAGRSGGQILIGGTGTTDDLTLRTTAGMGASGADMIFQVGNNGATEAVRILNSGFVGINNSAPEKIFHINGTDNDFSLLLQDSVATTNATFLGFRKSRGSFAVPGDVVAGDELGSYLWQAYSGSWFSTASIQALVSGAVVSGQRPGCVLDFFTNSANAAQKRNMRLLASGTLIIENDVGTAGATANAAVDNLILADSGTGGAGLTIYSPDNTYKQVAFGGPTSNYAGIISYGGPSVGTVADRDTITFFLSGFAIPLQLTPSLNLLIGGAAKPTTGTGGVIFPDGTALATMASNTAGLYADDISGNVSMHAINENGDVIKLIKTNTYTQTFATADRTFSAYTSDPESSAYTGIDNAQAGSVYATVADLNQLRVAYETLRVHAEDIGQLVNGLIDDLQTIGMVG